MNNEKSIRFLPPGSFSRLIVLGTGRLVPVAAGFARENSIAVEVFLGPRQTDVRLDHGTSVIERLAEMDVAVRVEEVLPGMENGPYDTPDDRTIILSFGSPYIIRQDLIELYGGRIINSHASPLPEWRGGGGFSWRILAGDRRGNVCYHIITPGIDEGDIIFQKAYTFPPSVRYPGDYEAYAAAREEECLLEVLQGILEGRSFERIFQDEGGASYFPRLNTPAQAYIDWSWPGELIQRFVLAFSYPYEGAKTFAGKAKVHIFDCAFSPETVFAHPFFNGLVYRIHEGGYHVAVCGGTLVVQEDRLESEKPIRPGDRLFTPQEFLQQALEMRPVYTPMGLKDQ